MSAKEEEYMSAEELRNRLYHSLRDKGLVNSMKSQLRTSLVGELKQSMKGRLSLEDLQVPESGSLIHRASNSLVADHLSSCKYDYTYSVFLPECGIDKAKMLSNEDILQLLKISPQSRLYKKMTLDHPGKSRKGFLWQLLSKLCSLHCQSCQSTSSQTDLIKVATVSTLDEKMNVLDDLFSSRREEQYRTGATALEDRLLKFQRQLEERFKSELKLEVSRVKDDEVSRIRLEEKENFRREFDKARKDLERTYQGKYDALVIRERNATERIQREQEMQEKEIYNQRQSILEEIEAVRQREATIRREGEVISREKKLDSERVKAKEQDVRHRELENQRREREFEQRLENSMTKFKVEYQAKFLERSQNIEVREATLRGSHDEEPRVSSKLVADGSAIQSDRISGRMEMEGDEYSPKEFYPQSRVRGKEKEGNGGYPLEEFYHQSRVGGKMKRQYSKYAFDSSGFSPEESYSKTKMETRGHGYPPEEFYPQSRVGGSAGFATVDNGYFPQNDLRRNISGHMPGDMSHGMSGGMYCEERTVRGHQARGRPGNWKENEKHVAEDQGKIDSLKGELRDKTARVNELETFLQEARHKEVDATKHNEFLNAKLRDMVDYASLKDQNISYRTELENLKMRMAEIMQLNERERIRQEEMLRELRRPTSIAGYVERDDARPERVIYEHQRPASGRGYHEQTDNNDRLVRQFEQQTLQMREMNQELVDVKQTLAYTQKALSNEVYRKPQDGDTSRLVSFNVSPRSAKNILPSDNDSDLDLATGGRRRARRNKNTSKNLGYDRNDVYNEVDLDDYGTPKISTDFTTDGEESSNQSADIIAETKFRLKSLEKEAQNLEKAYVDFHYQMTNPASLPEPTRHSFRRSQTDSRSASKGRRGASPTASPIASRPMSSTPYQQGHSGSGAEGDVSTDSLHELRGSSSYNRKVAAGQDPVPKFSLSDMSDDEHGKSERVEKPRPITVDDLEARPGSPSIMVVQADPSSDTSPRDSSGKQAIERVPERQIEVPAESHPPAKLPPVSLDTAWKAPSLDDAWRTDTPAKETEVASIQGWEDRQREKEEERRRKEAEQREREQRELEKLQQPQQTQQTQNEAATAVQEKSEKSEEIDPVMKQYMALVQQKKDAPQRQESERTASQLEDEFSLTEEIKSEDDDGSADDFNW